MKSIFAYPEDVKELGLRFARDCAISIKKDLKGEISEAIGCKITNEDIRKILKDFGQGNFLAFGHGTETQITIREDLIPVFDIDDADLLSNKVCYFLACCTGKELGPKAIEKGALAFIGFKEEFTFLSNYYEDFMGCCISGIREYLLGKCELNEIEKITKESFEEKKKYFLKIKANQAAKWCIFDIFHMVFLLKE